MARDSFIISSVVAEALMGLDDDKFVMLTKAVFEYCINGKYPQGLEKEDSMMFKLITGFYIDKDLSNFDKIMERRSAAYQEWRKSVFKRDDYTCQCCGSKGGKLNAHHLKSFADYPDLRFDVDNGVTLCESCHKSFHGRRRRK